MGDAFGPLNAAHELNVLVRLLFAVLAGGAIGWNRHRAGKPAGAGTHALVALGAALFAITPAQSPLFTGTDALSRVIQGVATGIGFVGAGEIFRDRETGSRVRGLTSAAALWATAAIGIVAACSSWATVLIAAAMVLLVLIVVPRVERDAKPRSPETP